MWLTTFTCYLEFVNSAAQTTAATPEETTSSSSETTTTGLNVTFVELELEIIGDFNTTDGSSLSADCQNQFSQGFNTRCREMGINVISRIGNDLCSDLTRDDVTVGSIGSVLKVDNITRQYVNIFHSQFKQQ